MEVRSVVNAAKQEIASGSVSTAGHSGFVGSAGSTASVDANVDRTADRSLTSGEAANGNIDVDRVVDGVGLDGGNSSAREAKQLKTMVLKQALDILEGEAPASPSLEKATMQLEQDLEDIEPGAVDTFRSEHLADTINARGPAPAPHLRAAVAARVLSTADWGNNDEVANVITNLEHVAQHGRSSMDPSTYLCSKNSCADLGCGTGADPANAECDVTGEKKCADGHGKCRRGRGKVLDGKFKIEIMSEPGNFLYMPEWDESQVSPISELAHKAGEPGADGQWKVVLNVDDTLMMYTEKYGPDYWLSIEEHAGKKLLAYRGFTSPVACSFTVHTNKEGDQVYLRDVPFKFYITDGGKGGFKPDAALDKKAANLKFHPPLPDEVDMIADCAYFMSVAPLILACALLNL